MLTDTALAIIEKAKTFTQAHIRPFVKSFEKNHSITPAVITLLSEQGYLGMTLPKEYGGLGLDQITYGLITEEIGKACCSTRSLLTVHSSLVAETILRWGSKEQKEKWLPMLANGKMISAFALSEPDIGSDAANVKTQYQQKGKSFILTGKKKWITMGEIASLYLVIARNNNTVSAFLVERDRPGITVKRLSGMMAGKSAHLAEIDFKEVEIPFDNLLSTEGLGFTCIANTALDAGRYSIAWGGAAIAHEALDAMVSYARSRQQFNERIYKFPLIQAMIADAAINLEAGRALCLEAGRLRNLNSDDAIIKTTIAKYYTAKMAMKVTTDAIQVHGANGFHEDFTVERLFREAKVLEIIEGTSQVLQAIIAGDALSRYHKKYYTLGKSNE